MPAAAPATTPATAPANWPVLREELSLHPGPSSRNGWPSWILRDPVRNRFFRIDWLSFEILSRWSLGTPEAIAEAVNTETTLQVLPEDVVSVARILERAHLFRSRGAQGTAQLLAVAQAARQSAFQWLLHHYLFFRIPLLKPDRVLDGVAPYVGWLGSRLFRGATLSALFVGLVLLARQWDRFTSTLLDTFTATGAVTFALALTGAKVTHELAHALTAKRRGCRVPTMGLAFLVMWPVLYTDVNDAWMLPRRKDRLAVGAAGVLAELTLAAWATLAWGVLDDGAWKQAAFVLATTTWISSLLINLSPFMRFDGYFLAMDAFDLPNLHPRSFALARWRLREFLFGLGEDPPENFRPGTRRALVAFAFAVWLYRLILFLGIAVLVYHFFIKAVGIVLFCVEIGWFVVRPIWQEVAEWKKRGTALVRHPRGWGTLGVAALLLVLPFIPGQTGLSAPAMLRAETHLSLFPPVPARVEEVVVHNGQRVAAGDILFRLSAPDLVHHLAQTKKRIAVLLQELGASGFDPTLQSRSQSLREDLQRAIAERLGAERELQRLAITAPISGLIADMSPDIQVGQWVSDKEKLAVLLGGNHATVVAYVPEDAVETIKEGNEARFIASIPGRKAVLARVSLIEHTAIHALDAAPLASIAGGPIAVRHTQHTLIPDSARYRVHLVTDAPVPPQELIGTVHIDAEKPSLGLTLWRRVISLLVREANL